MPLAQLDKHTIIGLDWDDTFVGAGSSLRWCLPIQQYVTNHTNKEYHVVTFRNSNATKEIELLVSTHPVLKTVVKSITHLPDSLREIQADALCLGYIKQHSKTMFDKYYQDDPKEVDALLQTYDAIITFKARTCAKYSCTVMLDDMPNLVKEGCTRLGIEFVDSKTCYK